jgi:uncharacterized membrane protein
MLSFFGLVPKGHVLDVPNAVIGSLYFIYQLLIGIHLPALEPLTKIAALLAFGSTIFLAYQLTFVVFELCILCWTTHVINASMLYITFFTGATPNSSKVKST